MIMILPLYLLDIRTYYTLEPGIAKARGHTSIKQYVYTSKHGKWRENKKN